MSALHSRVIMEPVTTLTEVITVPAKPDGQGNIATQVIENSSLRIQAVQE